MNRETLLAPHPDCCQNPPALTLHEDKQNVQIGIATSVVLHAALLFIFAWMLGIEQTARELWKQARKAAEEPTVTMLFPEQVMPTPKLKPNLETKQYIRTTQNESTEAKPVKSGFISDRNTKAAAKEAPFPDATAAMPSMNGIDRPTLELANRKYQDGKPAEDNAGKPAPPAPAPRALPVPSPLQPKESTALPQLDKPKPAEKPLQMAKADATPMARMMEQMDKADARLDTGKLPLEVRKPSPAAAATAPPTPHVAPPTEPLAMPPTPAPPQKRELDNFSPFTQTAKVKGTISNKGDAAVDAEATPMGKFMRAVTSAVEKKWHFLRTKNADAVSYGYLKVRFYVNRQGHAEDIRFVEKANNPRMEDFTLEAILKADIPPIPKDLLPMLEKERFMVEYDIIIHD